MIDREAQDEWDIARENSIGNEKTIGEMYQEKIDKLEKERNQYKEKAREFENKYIEVTNLYLNSIPKSLVREKKEWIERNILENDYATDQDCDAAEYQVQILEDLLGKE